MLKPIVRSVGSAETCFVLVHGTFARNLSWLSPQSVLVNTLVSLVATADIFSFCWDGRPQQISRYNASQELSELLRELRATYKKLIVVGHSHGGNIGLQAIQSLPPGEIHLITIATPFLRPRWTNPRTAIAELFIAFVSLFILSTLASIAWYTVRHYEVPVVATLIAAVAIVGSIYFFFRIQDSISSYIDARRRPYSNLVVHCPIKVLVLYLAEDEVAVTYRFIQARFRQIIGMSSSAKATAEKVQERTQALKPLRLPIILFFFGVVLAVAGVDAMYVMLVFTLMALIFVINFFADAVMSVWGVFSKAITSIFWPVYSAVQSGNALDPFFVFVRVTDAPRVQKGCGAIVIAQPIHLGNTRTLIDRLAKRSWLHNAICESPGAMTEIAKWLTGVGVFFSPPK